MAQFIYRSTIYGPQTFTVLDSGGVVEKDGKKLSAYGGYLTSNSSTSALLADIHSLEVVARAWWKKRNEYLTSFGHKANGVEP